MQHALNKYYEITTPQHAPKQGIAPMIDSGIQIRPINLNRSLIEHNIILRIEHIVAVPVCSFQKLLEHKDKYADLLIRDKHGLPSMYIIDYLIHIPLLEVSLEYRHDVVNEGIGMNIILAKSSDYPMQLV